MTLEEFLNKEENKIDKETACELLEKFKGKFITADYNPKNQKKCWLLWANLVCKAKLISTEDFESIPLAREKKVYFYSDRDRQMFRVPFAEVCELVAGMEPWEEVDAEIFDDSYKWMIAITHEEETLVYGVEENRDGK